MHLADFELWMSVCRRIFDLLTLLPKKVVVFSHIKVIATRLFIILWILTSIFGTTDLSHVYDNTLWNLWVGLLRTRPLRLVLNCRKIKLGLFSRSLVLTSRWPWIKITKMNKKYLFFFKHIIVCRTFAAVKSAPYMWEQSMTTGSSRFKLCFITKFLT